MNWFLLFFGAALAAPGRGPLAKPPVTEWSPGRAHDRVVVKVVEGAQGTPVLDGTDIRPLFQRPPGKLRADKARYTPKGASLDRYFLVDTSPGAGPAVADQFNDQDWVELAYLAFAPQPPPVDLAPATPDFTGEQDWLDWAPVGFGFLEGDLWPGGDGSRFWAFLELGFEVLPERPKRCVWGYPPNPQNYSLKPNRPKVTSERIF